MHWPWARRQTVPRAETRQAVTEQLTAGLGEFEARRQELKEQFPELDYERAEALAAAVAEMARGSSAAPVPFQVLQLALGELREAQAAKGAVDPSRTTYPMSDAMSQMTYKVGGHDVPNRARKITLYQTFIQETAVSICCEAIAGRLVSGGYVLKPGDPDAPDEASKQPLEEFVQNCNPDDDFDDLVHDGAQDLLWAGECYYEVTWKHSPALGRQVPYELFSVDAISMDYVLDPQSKKFITQFVQTTDDGKQVRLQPFQIIRIWTPDPRNHLRALAPLEKLFNPTTWDTYMQLHEQKLYEQGNLANLCITLKNGDETEARRLYKWLTETYLGVKNAWRPKVMWADIETKEMAGQEKLDLLPRRKFAREEIFGVYHTPPQLASLVESGNLGQSGMTDKMDKQFVHTAVDPLGKRIHNRLNKRLTVEGFGIDDWKIGWSYADFRDTAEVVKAQDMRIRNGSATINQIRADNHEEPVVGGDEAVFALARELVRVRDFPQVQSSQVAGGDAAAITPLAGGTPAGGKPAPQAARPQQRPREHFDEAALLEAAHDYGSAQFDLPDDVAAQVLAYGRTIPDAALAEDGRETRPHVTVRYGLTDPAQVQWYATKLAPALAKLQPASFQLGPTNWFEQGLYDVLVIDVFGRDLERLHDLVGQLFFTVDTHPGYHPHVAVVYLKPGLGRQYGGDMRFYGLSVSCDELTVSDQRGHAQRLRLGQPGDVPPQIERNRHYFANPVARGESAARQDLAFWERVALKRAREGKRQRPWTSDALPAALVEAVDAELAGARTVAQVREVFARQRGHTEPPPQWLLDHVARAEKEIGAWHQRATDEVLRRMANVRGPR